MFYDPKWDKKIDIPDKGLEEWQLILLKAAALIEKKGWTKAYSAHGRYCAVGAIRKASGLRPYDEPIKGVALKAEKRLLSYVRKRFTPSLSAYWHPYSYNYVEAWNDDQSRRKIVVKTMRDCALGKK